MTSVRTALGFLALLTPAAPLAGQAQGERLRDSIPGTLVTFDLVRVPGGTVTTGEGATTEVAPFWIGATEVTWDMYDVFAFRLDLPPAERTRGLDAASRPSRPYGAPDYGWGHRGFPAMSIAAPAAVAFTAWLSERTGHRYRLATDAEWQRAADLALGPTPLPRARLDSLAWHFGNADGRTHPVATRAPDALGLADLLGNVMEWVSAGDRYVTRGGSYADVPDALAVPPRAPPTPAWQERDPQYPKSRWWLSDGPFVGFRLVRD